MRQGHLRKAQARGAVLLTALIFLVVLSLLGISAALHNTLQERMAGNTRNRDLAFQAAEHALVAAESVLASLVSSGGILSDGEDHPNDASYWRNTFNWVSGSKVYSPGGTPLSIVMAQPKYVVESLSVTDCDDVTPGNQPCDYYRVTTRGVGAVGDVVVILQGLYQLPD